MQNIDPDIQKEAVKEGIKEWLNDQFATFGKWSFMALMSAAFAGLIYLALVGFFQHK